MSRTVFSEKAPRGDRCAGVGVLGACRHTAVYQVGHSAACERHLAQLVKLHFSAASETVEVSTQSKAPRWVRGVEETDRVVVT